MPVKRYSWGMCDKLYSYTLIIAEKPKAARRIAEALSNGRARKCLYKREVPYWYFTDGYNYYVVASAVGHLFGLKTNEHGFPVFNYYWAPIWEVDAKAYYTKKYYELLEKLSKKAILYINACDYDIEGSVIGYMIIRFLGDPRRAKRMKYSSLTNEELRNSFSRLEPLDKPMIEAGMCRHELDWLWGINISRALMRAYKLVTGKRISLSAGRVQSPTLIEVVNREKTRRLHIPVPVPSLVVQGKIGDQVVSLELISPKPKSFPEAKGIAEKLRTIGRARIIDVKYKDEYMQPPPPFNLGDLQSEAARIYGYSPARTQRIAEQLYLDALISYPRTNSQKLPPTLNYKEILKKIAGIQGYRLLVEKLFTETSGYLKPRQGVKEDPAHPAIYPTGVKPIKLSADQWKIYDLIVRRFMATFSKPARIRNLKAVMVIDDIKLGFSAKTLIYAGWTYYYPYIDVKAVKLPVIRSGEHVKITRVAVRTSYTQPPKAYTKIGIVKWMEANNIGTEATRARIMETLFTRKYLEMRGGKVTVTDLGFSIAETLAKYFSKITSVELTRKFEEYMNDIRMGVRSREQVLDEARKTLLKLIDEYMPNIRNVGVMLAISMGVLKPRNKCSICNREAVAGSNLCIYHKEALENLKSMYNEWKKVLPGITWQQYVEKIAKMKNAGLWVREVAEHLTSSYQRSV